jgi:adenine deaminase
MDQAALELGVNPNVDDPFLTLAFMALPVIPDLKLTDKGLFDVTLFKPIRIEVE